MTASDIIKIPYCYKCASQSNFMCWKCKKFICEKHTVSPTENYEREQILCTACAMEIKKIRKIKILTFITLVIFFGVLGILDKCI